jgi:hypothetical protein
VVEKLAWAEEWDLHARHGSQVFYRNRSIARGARGTRASSSLLGPIPSGCRPSETGPPPCRRAELHGDGQGCRHESPYRSQVGESVRRQASGWTRGREAQRPAAAFFPLSWRRIL